MWKRVTFSGKIISWGKKHICADVHVITAWSMYMMHDNHKFAVVIDLPP